MTATTFWEKLCVLCKENSTSPSAVAKKIGLNPAASGKWKKGSLPKPDTLIKIATLLNVSPTFLINEKNDIANKDDIVEKIMLLDEQRKDMLDNYVNYLLSLMKE